MRGRRHLRKRTVIGTAFALVVAVLVASMRERSARTARIADALQDQQDRANAVQPAR
jgi:hypothetical protein